MKKYFALLALLLLVSSVLVAQSESKPQPYSFGKKGISQAIDVNIMPFTDNETLLKEDDMRQDKSLPLRAGIGHSVAKTLDNSGRKDVLDDGSILWRAEFVSEGAFLTYLVFDRFNIPEEAELFIYSPDQTQVFGPYTNSDVQSVGKLVTDDIIGDEVIVEYYEPANASFKGDFQIAAVMHVYRDFLHAQSMSKGPHGDADGDCHINVACPEAKPWRYPINAVVCISITANVPEEGGWGMYLCSGAMVNNVRQDKTLYVLSAEHCVAADDQTHKFYFNYQLNECNGTTGIYNNSANGGVIVARSGAANNTLAKSDFLLLKITRNLNTFSWRDSIFFAGWDRSGAASVGAGIHHPGGDWKKISFPKSVVTITSGNMANKYFKVSWQTNPNMGVTEQGSSGSPLFNADQLIIGTLTSGSSSCDYIYGTDNYGRMYYHWNNNNAPNAVNRLQPWLDPDNTGAVTLRGMKYDGTIVGVPHYETSTFEIYPNPTQDGHITIQGEFMSEQATCHIYNVLGQLVKSEEVMTDATFSLNVSALDNGVYFVDILGSGRTYRSKLIIAR